MKNSTVPSPKIIIKDEQAMENIHWEDCVFLLKIGKEELQWAVYKRDTNYFVRICYYSFDATGTSENWSARLKEILQEEELEPERCYKVKVIVDTPIYTVVPDELYQEDLKRDYLASLFGEHPGIALMTDTIAAKKMQLVYGIEEELRDFLEGSFPRVSIIHNQSLLLRYIHRGIGSGTAIYATLHPRYTSFMVYSDDQLLLAQAYKTVEPLDVVYHSLNLLKQLEIEEKPALYLTGYNEHTHFIKEKIADEFEEISCLKRPKGCLFPQEMSKYASYYFFHLVYLALCELLVEN